jgi:predicted kinase
VSDSKSMDGRDTDGHIWLNGPFGVGKSSLARGVVRLHPNARLIDPERIGHGLRRRSPEARASSDFRQLPQWREETARALLDQARRPGSLLVVPMTITQPEVLAEILQPLSAAGIRFRCITLMASVETIRRRIDRRLDWPRSKRWARAHLESDLAALAAPAFAPHIWTEGRTIAQLARQVLAIAQC